jgi:hypothetical protein
MDYQPFIQAATPIVLTFATTVAGLAWNEFRKSAKFQQLGWVQRTMADVIANAVAHTYATKVRQWKESAPDGKLTAGRGGGAIGGRAGGADPGTGGAARGRGERRGRCEGEGKAGGAHRSDDEGGVAWTADFVSQALFSR